MRAGFINTSIVDYESKDNTCEISNNDFEDELSEFNIYEKIQILLFLNQYDTYITPTIPYDNKLTNSIPIPKKKQCHS